MAAVSINTTNNHAQIGKRIINKNRGTKMKTSQISIQPNPMEINRRDTATAAAGVRSRSKDADNELGDCIKVNNPSTSNNMQSKDSKTNAQATNMTAARKSVRLMFRRVKTRRSKQLLEIETQYPKDIFRTVELINNNCDSIESKSAETKILFLAALGLCPTPDERGFGYQLELIRQECENIEKNMDSSSEQMVSSPSSEIDSPVEIDSAINSPTSDTNENLEEGNEAWKIDSTARSQVSETNYILEEDSENFENVVYAWGANLNVVITPILMKSNGELSPIFPNTCDVSGEDDGDWKSFGDYIEAQLEDETTVDRNYTTEEIEEAKMKLASIPRNEVY